MMNNIDFITIKEKIEDYVSLYESQELCNLRKKKVHACKWNERVRGIAIRTSERKKNLYVCEIFLASNYSLAIRDIEDILIQENEKDKDIPIISKSAIDRYLKSDFTKEYYGENIYNQICQSGAIKMQEKRKIGGMNFQQKYQTTRDEHGYFNGCERRK